MLQKGEAYLPLFFPDLWNYFISYFLLAIRLGISEDCDHKIKTEET